MAVLRAAKILVEDARTFYATGAPTWCGFCYLLKLARFYCVAAPDGGKSACTES